MKLPKIFHRKRSIARRLTWRVILTVTLVFAAISAFIFGILWVLGGFILGVISTQGIDLANERINNVFTNIEASVAYNKTAVEENIGNLSKQYDAQKQLLKLNSDIIGAAVAYNPDSKRLKGKTSAAYVYRDSTDSTAVNTKQLNNKKYDYLHQEWFTKPCEAGKGTWSEPYLDEGGGNTPMITYSLPLTDEDGEVYAVMTADLGLNWLRELAGKSNDIFEIAADDDSQAACFIATEQGNFVAHTDSSMVLNETLESYLKKRTSNIEKTLEKIKDNNSDFALFYDNEGHIQVVLFQHLKNTNWLMGVLVSGTELMEPVNIFIIIFVVIIVIGLCIIALVCSMTIRRVTKPLRKFADSADEIAKGNFTASLPKIKTKDEMYRLRNSFETMQLSLIRQIEETKAINAEKGRMEGELQTARSIQMSMLPKTFPPYPDRDDIDIYGQLVPAKEVGGDLFDFYIRDEKLFFCIGDVSGKGVPASLVMAVSRSLFRNIAAHTTEPQLMVRGINESLSQQNDTNMFVTLFVGVLDLQTFTLDYCNAGHDSPAMIADGEVTMLPCDSNIPAGVMSGWQFTRQQTQMQPGSSIFLYTDGLNEAEDSSHRQFGMTRVVETAQATENAPQQLIATMTEAVRQFVGPAEQSDDLTMLAIKVTNKNA